MSSVYLPATPGLTWDVVVTPTFSTVTQRSRSRAETRLANDVYPLWEFELTYEFLRDYPGANGPTADNPAGYSDLELLAGFYLQRLGSFDSFLLDPGMVTGRPGDAAVADAALGTGDGVTTAFQLVRPYGGFLDEVQAPQGPVTVNVDGLVQATGWTLGANGVVNFTAAPAVGAALTADFEWAWPVRFAEDSLGVKGFMYQLYDLQSMKLSQVKL